MLRSDRWIVGDDEVALEHRVALRSAGLSVDALGGRPVIGVADSSSELNPCHMPLRALGKAVRQGVTGAGGLTVEFPTMALGEDLMKPTATLYRNLLAMEVEKTLRAYPIDGVVLLVNCDKTVPGALMGAASTRFPTILVTGGSRKPCTFRGRRLGTGVDLWRLWDQRRRGLLDDIAWKELEGCLSWATGACNTMGTTSTMAILAEVLGFSLPGSSTVPAGDAHAIGLARAAGRRIVEVVIEDRGPFQKCDEGSFRNALKVLNAIGGSTNAVLHLAALAGRMGIAFDLDTVDRLGRGIPLLADVEPAGAWLLPDLDAAGGVPALLCVLGDMLEDGAMLADGRSVAEVAAAAPSPSGPALRSRRDPLSIGGAFRVVRGTLAPDGAVLKRSSAPPRLLRHRGRAIVFRSYEEMRHRVDAPGLDVDETSVLVLAGCGPVGGPGIPEWGMIPLPSKLLKSGVFDVVRATDGRMSGTSYGTVYLHVAPEAAIGGPIALVQDGDVIEADAEAGRLDLLVDRNELENRAAAWRPPQSPHRRGWPALYRTHVRQAPSGCDLDFLQAADDDPEFVEPVIGRS